MNDINKIILNKRSDLINIPIQELRTAQIKNFSGKLFEQIYKEAIDIEHKQNTKLNKTFLEEKENNSKVIKIINKKINPCKELKENINIEINKIKFEIKYDSIYGEEVGILGSNDILGNWNLNKIFYLKWNDDNIWNGVINVKRPYNDFEFKFVITDNKNIKKWEKGYNNRIIFESLINEIKYKNNGYFDKYEYYYDSINKELNLKCRWI